MNLNEEIGRNYHTLDTDPYSWKDYSDIEVNIYASSHNDKWVAQVKSHTNPELSTMERSFGSETEANHWARSQVEYIKRHTMNENLLRKYVRNLLLEAYISPSSLSEDFALYNNSDNDFHQGFLLYRKSTFINRMKEVDLLNEFENGRSDTINDAFTKCLLDSTVAAIKVSLSYPGKISSEGRCNGAWEVKYSRAIEGFGPTLYDIIMNISPDGIYSDRMMVSGQARKVWSTYVEKRPDVKKKYLDPHKKSPIKDDDCSGNYYGSAILDDNLKDKALNFIKVYYPDYYDVVDSLNKKGGFRGSSGAMNVIMTIVGKREEEGEDWDTVEKEMLDEWQMDFEAGEFYLDHPYNKQNDERGNAYLNISHNIDGKFDNVVENLIQSHNKFVEWLQNEVDKKVDSIIRYRLDRGDSRMPNEDFEFDEADIAAYRYFENNWDDLDP